MLLRFLGRYLPRIMTAYIAHVQGLFWFTWQLPIPLSPIPCMMPHALRRITQEECGSRLLALQAGEGCPVHFLTGSMRSLSQEPLPASNSAPETSCFPAERLSILYSWQLVSQVTFGE